MSQVPRVTAGHGDRESADRAAEAATLLAGDEVEDETLRQLTGLAPRLPPHGRQPARQGGVPDGHRAGQGHLAGGLGVSSDEASGLLSH
jgi:hypothetical protein